MKRTILGLLAATLFCGSAFAQVDERVMYASVVDDKGQPIVGLNVKDLIVREDGQTREILRVAKDDDPMQVALLVDNSVEMRNKVSDLRKAIAAFISALRPGVQVALLTLAERPTIVVNYSADKAALLKGVDKIVAYEAGNYVLDGIAEAAEGMSKRTLARSVMVVVTGQGPELSYRHYTDALRPLRASGAALHAIMVTAANIEGALHAVEHGNPGDSGGGISGVGRDIVLGRMTKETGGRYEEVLTMSALSAKLQQLSGEISNQYRVTFARPDRLIPPKNTEISARQPNQHARGMLMKSGR
ncbi:MAG TPA: VWA domain-containing protein [Vicinamibacterales bacterium]|jgi:VWFA-related protein|nr:VWA domain-containing protein [Vicinamibacterales bacterium]